MITRNSDRSCDSSSVEIGVFSGVLGAGGEYHLKQQKDQVEADFTARKIDQKGYEIRKDQIARDSLMQ